MFVIDASGSVENTFNREKVLAAAVIDRLILSDYNARVAVIKYAGPKKAKLVFAFGWVASNPFQTTDTKIFQRNYE